MQDHVWFTAMLGMDGNRSFLHARLQEFLKPRLAQILFLITDDAHVNVQV